MTGHPNRISLPFDAERRGGDGSRAADRVGIIANANSGVGLGRSRVQALARALEERGLKTTIAWSPAERNRLVREADAGRDFRCLVAVGGDGTLAALLNDQPRVPITVMPAGTENLFAGQFGLKPDPWELAKTIAEGRTAPIDLGLADQRRFSLMAGFGFDADVIMRHHLLRTRDDGQISATHRLAYVRSILASSFDYRFPAVTARILDPETSPDAPPLEGTMVLVFNLPRYALGLPVVPQSDLKDGWLDLIVFRNPGPLQMLRYLWMVIRGIHLNKPDVIHRRVRNVEVATIPGARVPVQLDGDPDGFISADAPRRIGVLPRAIEVIVPPSWRAATDRMNRPATAS